MNNLLHDALHDLAMERAEEAQSRHLVPDPAGLWQQGRARRRRGHALSAALVTGIVTTLVALLLLATSQPLSAPLTPADREPTHGPLTYPDYVAKPLRIQDLHTDLGPKSAIISGPQSTMLYAVAPDGGVTSVAVKSGPWNRPAALSPDGRWLAAGFDLVDLTTGEHLQYDGVAGVESQWMPVEAPGRWDPTSQRVFLPTFNQGLARSVGVVIDVGSGGVTPVPMLEDGLDVSRTVAGWLDSETLLALVPDQGYERMTGWTWGLGDAEWSQGAVEVLRDLGDDPLRSEAAPVTTDALLSPDGSRLLVARTQHSDGDVMTQTGVFDATTGRLLHVPSVGSGSVWFASSPCQPAWRDGEPVLVRDGGARIANRAEDMLKVSRWFADPCISFAGNSIQGTPLDGTRARAWETTQRIGFPVLLVVALGLGALLVRVRRRR